MLDPKHGCSLTLPLDETTSHSTKLANNASQVAGYAWGRGYYLGLFLFVGS